MKRKKGKRDNEAKERRPDNEKKEEKLRIKLFSAILKRRRR